VGETYSDSSYIFSGVKTPPTGSTPLALPRRKQHVPESVDLKQFGGLTRPTPTPIFYDRSTPLGREWANFILFLHRCSLLFFVQAKRSNRLAVVLSADAVCWQLRVAESDRHVCQHVWLVQGLRCIVSGRLFVSLSELMEKKYFPSVLRHCRFGDRKGIRPVKKTGCFWFVGGDDLTGGDLHDL